MKSFPASLRPYIVIVDAKDNVDLAGGVGFKEGKEIEAGENGGGELMGEEEFDVLGRVEIGAKEVGEIDGAEERVVRDDRVEEDLDRWMSSRPGSLHRRRPC